MAASGCSRTLLAVVAGCLACQPAWADYSCQGPVDNLGFSLTSGTVTINIGAGRHYLCALDPAHTAGNASFDAVSPEACATMYGTFLTAKSSGRSVKFWYSSASSTPNCQLPSMAYATIVCSGEIEWL